MEKKALKRKFTEKNKAETVFVSAFENDMNGIICN